MNFQESLEYLYNLGNEVLAMKLGLESTEKLLKALGNPEKNFLKIQIAGTNGKGSTCAFLDAICRNAAIKTGLFTSPHLISVTERIRINGAEISETDFARHATQIREISEKLVEVSELEAVPTFFEQITAIAISAFAEAAIELAILETGLGGRFDSVTATRAEIVAITPIDYDHQQILGNTLAEIAAEKAAIIREDTKVVLAPQKSEALRAILKRCEEVNAAPIYSQCEYLEQKGSPEIIFHTRKNTYPKVWLNLEGKHQRQNACLAVNLVEVLAENSGFSISDRSVFYGLSNAVHKGRLELKFYNDRLILFDGAHNTAGAKALRDYLDEFVTQPITMIFGSMRDKDLSETAETLFPKASILILTKPDNPRSMAAAELMQYVPPDFAKENLWQTETVNEALKIAREISTEKNLICVTGSLYLVGEAQKLLNNKSEI
jgi:dihydrofolate synthase/folylpolyglutamate synthase